VGWLRRGSQRAGAPVHDLLQDQQHVAVDDAVEQDAREQPPARQEVHHGVEKLLCLLVGRPVDNALGVDDAVQARWSKPPC
jgi:hypothetical protein